jgi:hypothetical protein
MLELIYLFHLPIPIQKFFLNLRKKEVSIASQGIKNCLGLLQELDTNNKMNASIEECLYKIHKMKASFCIN